MSTAEGSPTPTPATEVDKFLSKWDAAWWSTTLIGLFIPLLIALGTTVLKGSPWGEFCNVAAGSLGTALGVSHTGSLKPGEKKP